MQGNKEKNLIVELSFEFALKVLQYTGKLEAERKYVLAKQLLKSGTSIGANIRETQHAESRADFIDKLKIAAKEADETAYWLELCSKSDGFPECEELIDSCTAIIKVLSKNIWYNQTKLFSEMSKSFHFQIK